MAATFNCIFCKIIISCDGKDLSRFNSHIELEHGVYFKVELVMSLNFLSEEEMVELTKKLEPRLTNFLETGETAKGDSIFQTKSEQSIPEIQNILNKKLEGTTVSKFARRAPPGPPSAESKAKRRKTGESEINEEMLLMEVSTDKHSKSEDDEEIELSEDEMKEDESVGDENEKENIQRRLILMNLKNMIVNASTEAKEEVNPNEEQERVPSIAAEGANDEKSVMCKLCFSPLSRGNLRRHERRYHEDHLHLLKESLAGNDHVHPCDFCPVKLVTENLYGIHFIKNHCKEIFKCKKCLLKIEGKHKIERIEEHLVKCNENEQMIKPCKVDIENVPMADDFEYLKKKWEMSGNDDDGQEIHIKLEIEDTSIDVKENTAEMGDLEKEIICRLCYTKLSSPTNLKRHEHSVHQEDQAALALTSFTKQDLIYNCDMCPLQFLTENIMNTHKKTQHRVTVKSASVECKVCKKVVTTKSLKGHMQTHELEKNFECRLCYLKFKQQKSLSSHISNVHKNDEMINKEITDSDLKYPCNICELRFVSDEILKGHLRRHENNKYEFLRNEAFDEALQIFKCKLCYKEFKEFHKMKDHIVVNHKDDIEAVLRKITDEELTHPCDKCSSKFLSKTVLQYHKYRTHSEMNVSRPNPQTVASSTKLPGPASRLDCKLCYSNFLKPEMLKAHEESVHKFDTEFLSREIREEELIFSCHNCNLNFVTENIMLMHRRISFCDINK